MLKGVFDDATHVVVVQAVFDALALPLPHDEASLAEMAQVVGQRALLDTELLTHRAHV